jgi:protein tyrosine phosphatase (PTP) superfamily phosphohydrolase (DUF442 family)
MTPRFWIAAIALGSILLVNGCRHCCKKQNCPGPISGPSGPGGFTGAPNLPPQNLPPIDATPNTGRSSPEILLPTPIGPGASGYSPAPRNHVILGDPEFGSPAPAIEEKKQPIKSPAPPIAVDENPAGTLPVGIANYAPVKEGVNYGFRPDLDGLDWLQTNKTKTVVFLRSGKEDDSSDRRQVEKRGMTYKSLVVDPETINANLVAEFNQLVNDSSGRPLFVYDRDGTNAGAMWYLYFRTSEMFKDDEARVRAGRLGLKEKGTPDQAAIWTAVQKYMAERNP